MKVKQPVRYLSRFRKVVRSREKEMDSKDTFGLELPAHMETTEMPFDRMLDKEEVVPTYNGIPLSSKKG